MEENTVVVYTSDQGFFLGEHGWFDKRFMYEESFRTPLIIKAPDGLKGKIDNEHMVVNIDYAPTLLDYAGVNVPDDMQGRSMRQILKGNSPKDWRSSVYYHYFEYPAEHGVKRHYGIRDSRYKLIHFYYDVDEWEFYDLENDPNEMNNLYENEEYSDIISKLRAELKDLRIQYDDTDEKKYLPKDNFETEHKGIGGDVNFDHKYADKYSGNGINNLLDGWRGPEELISHVDYSVWQGFEKNDLIAHIDLKSKKNISKITAGFLHFIESWIFLPDFVEYEYSTDGINYVKLGRVNRAVDLRTTRLLREEYGLQFENIKTRYLKVTAKNVGLCPQWHQGAGRPAWVFSDEIKVE